MGRNIYKTYFSHDIYARQDQKIKDMLVHFRKESNLKAQAAYCIFWLIVEDMHADDYPVSKIDVFADDYRCDVEFLKSILEDFGLFRIENDCYISDRVLKNIAEQEEKSEKAKKSIQKRWNKKEDEAAPKDDELDFINQVLKIYNTEFKKTQIVSNENKARINKITKDNKLTLDIWQKVFENARRGWDFEDCKNKQPNLKTILDKWDLFASGDYYLAPDREKNQQAQKLSNDEEKEKLQKEKLIAKQFEEEKEKAFEAISDKDSSIKFINKYFKLPLKMLQVSKVVNGLKAKYSFTYDEILAERKG